MLFSKNVLKFIYTPLYAQSVLSQAAHFIFSFRSMLEPIPTNAVTDFDGDISKLSFK